MRNKKLALTLAVAGATMGLALTAFASPASAKELTVWCWDENFNLAAMKTAEKYYQEAGHDDFKLNVVNMPEEDIQTKLTAAFTAGVTDDLPDIVLMGDSWANMFLTNYPGCYVDLTDDIDYSQFAPYKVSCFTVDDRVYGVPFDSGSAGLFYRKDILEDAGINPDDLKGATWWDVIDMAKTIHEKTGKYGFQFDPSDGVAFTWYDSMLQSAGKWFYEPDDEDETGDFVNNSVMREVSEILKEMWNDDLVYGSDTRDSNGIGAIQKGDVAFVMNAIWYTPTLTSAKDASGLWDYANIPLLKDTKNVPYTNIGGSSWVILDACKDKDTAIDFMKTIWAGNTDFYDDILLHQGAVATWLPATKSDTYNTPMEFFNNKPIYKDFASWGAQVPSVSYGTNTWTVHSAIQAHLQEYFDGKYDLDGFLKAVQDTYEVSKS